MLELVKRRTVDLLVEQFWKHGYLTVSRKFGTYLPEPAKVGSFDVDIVAKQKNNYAIGITLTADDLSDGSINEKLNFLASRQTKYTNKRVLLFIGAPVSIYKNVKVLLESLAPEIKKNIRLFQIEERKVQLSRRNRKTENVLFS